MPNDTQHHFCRGFGDSKFVPNLDVEKFRSISRKVLANEFDFFEKHCIKPMFDYSSQLRNLGFPPRGITTYFSANCDESDSKIVTEYLNHKVSPVSVQPRTES